MAGGGGVGSRARPSPLLARERPTGVVVFEPVGVEGRCRVCPVLWGKNEAATDAPIRENHVSLRLHAPATHADAYSYLIKVGKPIGILRIDCIRVQVVFGVINIKVSENFSISGIFVYLI
jgi:hypothetical protein